jgi:predicted dehydrogenase
MRLAMIGCGYVANMYRVSLQLHPSLKLVGVFDRDETRANVMGESTSTHVYSSLDECLDDDIDIVLNLTNPHSHYEITKKSLEHGKHVYTEKPIAMDLAQAKELVDFAEANGLCLSSAPCTLLNAAAQTAWKAIQEQKVGPVRLVYAEMDAGMVHRMPLHLWVNELGVPWPYRDEFEVGCTVEHAGYVLMWLTAFFGPARSVTAFSTCIVPEKVPGETINCGPDYSVANINFESGVLVKLTCGSYAPVDLQIRMFGEDGVLSIKNSRIDHSPVYFQRYMTIRRKRFLIPIRRRCRRAGGYGSKATKQGARHRDFFRGISEMADAIRQNKEPYMSARFCLHVNEMVLAIHNAREKGSCYHMTTTFNRMQPIADV